MKNYIKLLAIQMAVQSVFTAVDETVRVFVRGKVGPVATQPRLDDQTKH